MENPLDYGAESEKTIGKLYVPGALLDCVKPAAQTVLKNACAAVPFVAAAPERKSASLALIEAYVPATAFDQVRSLIGFAPAKDPAYVQVAGLLVLIFRLQLRFALIVKVGPASAIVAPISTWSAVGELIVVVVALMPSLTSALTVAEAVLIVRQPPALPEHCALAWLAPASEPSTRAARRKRFAFIVIYSEVD